MITQFINIGDNKLYLVTDKMSALSVFDVPSLNAYYSDPNSLDTLYNLAVRTVNAYRDESGLAQTLTVGATSNLILEAKQDMNMYSTNGVKLYTTTMTNDTRQDDLIMTIDRSVDSNTTIVSSTSTHNLAFTASNEIHLGTTYLDLSGDSDKFKTNKAAFEFQNITVFDCNVHFQGSIITQGSVFGNNLNVWNTNENATLPTDATQIGYGFRVNASNQLELIKHVKFNDEGGKILNQRVAIFGSASNKYTATSDVNYLVFDELDGISVNNNGSITSVTNSPLDNYIFMNDDKVGIGNQFAQYKLDVTGEARVSSTIHAGNGIQTSGSIIPTGDILYDLGSAENRFRDLYLSGNIIYLADVKLSSEGGSLVVKDIATDEVLVSMEFTDSVSTTNSKIAASATAVKTAYDIAVTASNIGSSALTKATSASNMAFAASNAASNAYYTASSFDSRITTAETNASTALSTASALDNKIQGASNASSNAYFTALSFDTRLTAAESSASSANTKSSTTSNDFHNFVATGAFKTLSDSYATFCNASSGPYYTASNNATIALSTANATSNAFYGFYTNGTQAMSNIAIKNLAIGYTAASAKNNSIVVQSNIGIGTDTPQYPLHILTHANNISIQASYDIVAFSDATLKDNVRVIDGALDKVAKISGYTFTRKDDQTQRRMAGVLAQEVQAVLPEVVYTNPKDEKLAVAYGNLTALLIEGIKELKQKVELLESTLA